MSWQKMSENSADAAKVLAKDQPRSSVSRAYYAAYCGVSHAVGSRVSFKQGFQNLSHQQIISSMDQIKGLTSDERRIVKASVKQLLRARIDADYRPTELVDDSTASRSLSQMQSVRSILGL